MPKIKISVHPRAYEKNPQTDKIVQAYITMIERITPFLTNIKDYDPRLPLEVRQELLKDATQKIEWELSTLDGLKWNISSGLQVDISRIILPDRGMLYHKFFEIDKKLQGTGIADEVLKVSLEIADVMKLQTITLHANLDIGGYAWFRKGAWPNDGKAGVISLINDFGRRTRSPEAKALYYAALDAMEDLSEENLKKFVLSNEFRKFKPIFLGSDWNGSFNPNDPITRTAMSQGAEAAYEQLLRTVNVPKVIPLTVNEQIMNEFIKFQIRSINFSTSLARKAQDLLNNTEERIQAILYKYTSAYEEFATTATSAKSFYAALEKELTTARELGWVKVNQLVNDQLEQYALLQAKAAAKVVEGAVPAVLGLTLPSPRTLYNIISAKPFEGRLLADWLARTANADADRITKMAIQGIVDGQTPTQVANLVLGSKSMNGVDGYTRKAFRDLEALMLTATSSIQNQARQALYEQNSEVFAEEYFIATLDIRTTYECAGHDGEIYKRGQGPIPPLHFRCRSIRAPYISMDVFRNRGYSAAYEKQLVQEFAAQNKLGKSIKSREDLPRGLRGKYDNFATKRTRELVGQVPASTNFNNWLKKQTAEFQDEYLGKARAQEFRAGKFTVKDFTNAAGKEYTLEDLGIG